MNKQSINDQLELLRLKELFMSDIKIRSKMTDLISSDNERTDFKKFCEFTHCEPRIAKMLSQLWVIDMILTPKEIAAERKRLEALSYWNDNRQSLEKLAPCISILQDNEFAKSEAIIDGYNCELRMLLWNNELYTYLLFSLQLNRVHIPFLIILTFNHVVPGCFMDPVDLMLYLPGRMLVEL